MSSTIRKVNIIPVSDGELREYLKDEVLKIITPVRKLIDDYGSKYEHEAPWKKAYFKSPKFFLYRVSIGAVGRITNCEDAIHLGLTAKVSASSRHFVSMAHYYVYRIARQRCREYLYAKNLERWLNTFINDRQANSRFMTFHELGKMEYEEDEKTAET